MGTAYAHHEYARLFPMLSDDRIQELADDIAKNGLRQPIVVDADDKILDGRNRAAACTIAGVEPTYEPFVGTDEEKLKYSKDLGEHLSEKRQQEDSLRSYQTQAKAEIASHDAQINLLADKINTGREYRDVECRIEYNWDKKTREWYRLDTGVMCREDIILEEDLQEHMQLEQERATEEEAIEAQQ